MKIKLANLLILFLTITFFLSAKINATETSYKDIDGITLEEINYIENFKNNNESISIATRLSSECYYDDEGNRVGFSIELADFFTKYFGINFEVSMYDTLVEVEENIFNENDDFSLLFTLNEERKQKYYYTESALSRVIIQHRLNGAESFDNIVSNRKLKFGFLGATIMSTYIAENIKHPFDIEIYNSYEDIIRDLNNKTIDAYFDIDVADYYFKNETNLVKEQFFPLINYHKPFLTKKDSMVPFINILNKFLNDDGREIISSILKKTDKDFKKYLFRSQLTDIEKNYINNMINNNTKIKVGYENTNYPLSFYNSNENLYSGIFIDILTEVTELSGLEFKNVSTNENFDTLLSQLGNNEIQMISELVYVPSREGSYLWSKNPYSSSNFSFLTLSSTEDIDINDINRLKIGVEKDTVYDEYATSWFPNAKIFKYSDFDDAVSALENGDLDVIFTNENHFNYLNNYKEKGYFKIAYTLNYSIDSFIGYSLESTILRDIVDKALAQIDTIQISYSWKNKTYNYTLDNLEYRNKIILFASVFITIFLIVVIAGVLYINIKVIKQNKKYNYDLFDKTLKLETLINSMPDGVFTKDTNLKFTSVNDKGLEIYGKKREDFLNKNVYEIFESKERSDKYNYASEQVIHENKTVVYRDEIVVNGEKKYLEIIKSLLKYDEEHKGILFISRDITEKVKVEQELIDASNAKTAFLANMSHEIRTPLNAIVGMANIIKATSNNFEIQKKSEQILQSSKHLLNIFNDILDMSKIESGKVELVNENINLYENLLILKDMIENVSKNKNQELNIDFEDLKNKYVYTDGLRLNQVLMNLASNAIKFTPNGGKITVKIKNIDETADKLTIYALVSDTGIGINEEQKSKLFMPFEQTKNSISIKYGGTGLGLYISQRLINLFGGTIDLESIVDVGSKFFFTITLKKVDYFDSIKEEVDQTILSGTRILLFEDIDINRDIVEASLSNYGIVVYGAENGLEGFEMFMKSEKGYYGMILMDIQMPVMDGYEATKAIRESSHPDAKTIPIIALSANVYSEDIKKSKDAGMDDHISKPLDIDLLLNKIIKYLKK